MHCFKGLFIANYDTMFSEEILIRFAVIVIIYRDKKVYSCLKGHQETNISAVIRIIWNKFAKIPQF